MNYALLKNYLLIVVGIVLAVTGCQQKTETTNEESPAFQSIRVSDNQRYFQYEDGNPFFWLGDTGWLVFRKLNRDEIVTYLDDRKDKGYNVIQVMLLHTVEVDNFQGDKALIDGDVSRPIVTEGSDPTDSVQYDYWDHVQYTLDLALERGLYLGLVPIWGSPVHNDQVTPDQAKAYAQFLVERFGDYPNIIWLDGGDIRGDDHQDVWLTIGETIDSLDSNHLITFHPRGRTMSSEWFHDEPWLDFNMFQSGHRSYEQDTASDSHRFGPDNWKYIDVEYNKSPIKPTLDGEPSYEGIPHGLHDTTELYWDDADLRRYAYWSVFAGGAGFTYGSNSVMQFYDESKDKESSFGPRESWQEGIKLPGSAQMQYLKNLILSKPYFERMPDQRLIENQGEKYEYMVGTKGKDYAMVYTFTGRDMEIEMGRINGDKVKATWFEPSTGNTTEIGEFENKGKVSFDPPGEPENGNDWVLILEKV